MSFGHKAVCLECAHFHIDMDNDSDRGWCCDAFPEGVPEEIYAGGNPHTESVPGDHGIRFERK